MLVGFSRLSDSKERSMQTDAPQIPNVIKQKLSSARTCVPVPALLVTESFLAAPEWSLTTIVVFVDSPDWSC